MMCGERIADGAKVGHCLPSHGDPGEEIYLKGDGDLISQMHDSNRKLSQLL